MAESGKNDNKVSSSSSSSDDAEEVSDRGETTQITGVEKLGILINRDEYLALYRDLQCEHAQLTTKNSIFMRRLVEYYKKRKLDHALKEISPAMVGGVNDLEDLYNKKLYSYEELKELEDAEMQNIRLSLEDVEQRFEERDEHARMMFGEMENAHKAAGLGLMFFKKGNIISDRYVERLTATHRFKFDQLAALRLRYIRARNAVSDLEATVRRLETVGPGLTVAFYNQLMVDHQNFEDKIEEREDDLIKNRNKVTEHSVVLAHIREKMHHTEEVIDRAECDHGDAHARWLRAREDLSTVKSRRDALRTCLIAENQKAGLLTRIDLLRDFESAVDELQILIEEKKELEDTIARDAKSLRAARKMFSKTPAACIMPLASEFQSTINSTTSAAESTQAISINIQNVI